MFRRIYHILLHSERKGLFRAIGRMFIGVLLDFASIASMLPVLYFLLDREEENRVAVLFSLLAGCVLLLKYGIGTLISKHQIQFSFGIYKRLSCDLYLSYYHKGLLFIRQKGTNRLNYEINSLCYAFSNELLNPLIRIMSDMLLIVVVMLALLFYDYITALYLTISFLPLVLTYLIVVRRRVAKYGKELLLARREQWHTTTETFDGFMEIEVCNGLGKMFSNFEKQLGIVGKNRLLMIPYARIPLLLSEIAVVLGLLILSIISSENLILWIGVFAVSAFRLLPAVRSILSGWTEIQRASFCLEILEKGIEENRHVPFSHSIRPLISFDTCDETKGKSLLFQHTLSISHLEYTYPEGEKVFEDFSCLINQGEYVGFKGYSGVGKSTLFNLLLGFLTPDKGEIRIDDVPLSSNSYTLWRQQVGYVPQEVFLCAGTLAENIALGCERINRERIHELLKMVCLEEWVQSLPQGIDTPLTDRGSNLSGGERQRIGIARSLYRKAHILLLDEATSALDNNTEEQINLSLCSLRKKFPSLTILSIAHRESSLKYCDRVIEIQ